MTNMFKDSSVCYLLSPLRLNLVVCRRGDFLCLKGQVGLWMEGQTNVRMDSSVWDNCSQSGASAAPSRGNKVLIDSCSWWRRAFRIVNRNTIPYVLRLMVSLTLKTCKQLTSFYYWFPIQEGSGMNLVSVSESVVARECRINRHDVETVRWQLWCIRIERDAGDRVDLLVKRHTSGVKKITKEKKNCKPRNQPHASLPDWNTWYIGMCC